MLIPLNRVNDSFQYIYPFIKREGGLGRYWPGLVQG